MTIYSVNELSGKSLPEIGEIHLAAFPTSALTQLGVGAIRRYYHWLMEGPHDCCAIGAFSDGVLAGFCFGGVFRGAMVGFLRKHWLFLSLRIISHPWLLFNPIFAERIGIARKILVRKYTPVKSMDVSNGYSLVRSCGILSVAVRPEDQNKGVGKLLMSSIEAWALKHGFEKIHLSVHPENENARSFYGKLGYKSVQESNIQQSLMQKNVMKLGQTD